MKKQATIFLLAVTLEAILAVCGKAQEPARAVPFSPNIPSTCAVGDLFFRTSGTIGLYQCTATNTYTVVSGGGGGGSGTVTSVGLSMPTGLTVGGSPVTTSGTISVTTSLNGVVKGNGSGFAVAVGGTDYEFPLTFTGSDLTRSTNTITLATTAVTPGTYTLSTITVDSKGRITSASSGGSSSTVAIQDEGVGIGSANTINCVGSGILCTFSSGTATFTVSGGSGSLPIATLVSSNYVALTTDFLIAMDTSAGNRTVTLFAAAGNTGKYVEVTKRTTDANTVAVTDGTNTYTIYGPGASVRVASTGSAWVRQ